MSDKKESVNNTQSFDNNGFEEIIPKQGKWASVWPNDEKGIKTNLKELMKPDPNHINCELPKFKEPCPNCKSGGAHCWEWGSIDGKWFKYDRCENRQPEKVKNDASVSE